MIRPVTQRPEGRAAASSNRNAGKCPMTAEGELMRAAIYVRVSTDQQTVDNQLLELRRYVAARGWQAQEYVDRISGAKESRPALDAMLKDAKRRRIDAICCWRLDRLGRSLKHLIMLIDELNAL